MPTLQQYFSSQIAELATQRADLDMTCCSLWVKAYIDPASSVFTILNVFSTEKHLRPTQQKLFVATEGLADTGFRPMRGLL